jgi:hypothetical protein
MASREFAMGVVESAYGTPKATPVAGTDSFVLRLDGSNSFTPFGVPQQYEVPYGGGRAITAFTGSDQMAVAGQLSSVLYGSQLKFLANLALVPMNAGQTAPWTSTEPVGDLASMSFYHAATRSDNTLKRWRYAGGKATRWQVTCSRSSKIARMTLGLMFQKYLGNPFDASSDPTVGEFPAPAESAYPIDPFRFIDINSQISLAGVSRSQLESITITCENRLDGRWFENRFLSLARNLGRSITVDLEYLYKATPDDIATFQNTASIAGSVGFTNGTNTLTLNLNSNNVLTSVEKNFELDRVYTLRATVKNNWDPAANAGAGGDVTVVIT